MDLQALLQKLMLPPFLNKTFASECGYWEYPGVSLVQSNPGLTVKSHFYHYKGGEEFLGLPASK